MNEDHPEFRAKVSFPLILEAEPSRREYEGVRAVGSESAAEHKLAFVWLEAIFEGSRDAIFISDDRSGLVAVNRAASHLTGYSREELLGMRIPDLHDEGDLDAYSSHHKPIMEGKELLTSAWLRRKDGHRIYVDFSNRRIDFLGRRLMHTVARDVTVFHQSQGDLSRAKEYAEAVVEAAGLLVLELDEAGCITSLNEAATARMGPAGREILGRRFQDLLASEAGNGKAAEEFERWRNSGAQCRLRIEGFLAAPRETPSYIAWTIDRMAREKEPAGLLCLGSDLTERHRAEESLRESEERYRKLVELCPDGIALHSEGCLTYANAALVRIAGVQSYRDLIGKSVTDFVAPESLPLVLARRQQLLESGKSDGWAEIKLLRLDGSCLQAEVSAVSLLHQGKLSILQVVRDVSELRRAEESMRNILRAVDQIPSAVVITDSTGKVEFANPALATITGHSLDETVSTGACSCSLFQRADASGIDVSLHDTLTSPSEWSGEFPALRKDGGIYQARLTLSPINDAQGKVTHLVLTCEDVTERRRMQEKVLVSQKLEAIGTLAGGVAHDFNNLLTVINGYSDIILDQVPQDDPNRPDLDQIRKAGQKAASLTAQLLAFSRNQIVEPRVLDLNSIVRESEKMLRRLLREDIELVMELHPKGCRIKADPGQIAQVVMNITVNARDAMPEGGRLLLRTAAVEFLDELDCGSERLSPGRYALIEITDSGCGMDPVTLSRIFEPFFTTKESGKGTGLGMSTVYGIVTQNGGDIHVKSAVDKGTKVQVYLPIVGEAVSGEAKLQIPVAALGGNETILLVEDDTSLRALIARILAKYGYRVLVATDGVDALAISHGHPGPIDLLVSDIVMPRMNGHELALTLAGLRPDMKRMFISGYSEEETKCVRNGVPYIPFLMKPFTAESLSRKVRAVLEANS